MKPFDFIILFFSFIYSLGLTHLLFAATRMIRHRRRLVFSWPHALWMVSALGMMFGNWLSLWDFRAFDPMSLGVIVGGFAVVVMQYVICALVSPDLETEDDFDLRRFHQREGRTYLVAFLAFLILCLAANAAAGSGLGVRNWADQNWTVLAMFAPVILALTVRANWAQVAAPLAMVAMMIVFPIVYYPALR
ncbi:MAG TPA: hypothetical protein VGL58_19450 [Caulobacteraceae bacterium]